MPGVTVTSTPMNDAVTLYVGSLSAFERVPVTTLCMPWVAFVVLGKSNLRLVRMHWSSHRSLKHTLLSRGRRARLFTTLPNVFAAGGARTLR